MIPPPWKLQLWLLVLTLEVLYVDRLDYYVEEVVLRIVVRSTIHVPCRSEYVMVETTVRGRRDGRVGKCCGWLANDQCSPCEIHVHKLVFSEVYLLFCILLNKLNIWNQQKQTHKDWWLFQERLNRTLAACLWWSSPKSSFL